VDAGLKDIVRHRSPIFEPAIIANPNSVEEGEYCLGWCHHKTPAKLGLISPNRDWESPKLGSNSDSIVVYGHQGDIPGYTSNLYIVPDSKSAVVILSNGTGLSDATDWIAQDLLQIMHGLQPAVNFVDLASKAAAKYVSHYDQSYKAPLEKHRVLGTQPPPLSILVGSYTMDLLDTVCLDMTLDTKDTTRMLMTVNKQPDQVWEMRHYHYNVWSHLPDSYDKCICRGVFRPHWSEFLISFDIDPLGVVKGLSWKMDGVDVYFSRV